MSKKKIITQTDLDNLRDELTALIESKITFITVDKVNELPATPPKAGESGRKKLGERHDLRARVDKVIFENLDNYANTYFSSNVSAALDAILWNFFDKPKLSFEEEK
jgi:hypothetical protein